MHMADALVSTAVGSAMWCGAGGTLGYSVKKMNIDLDERKIPMMGIMGAFIFASQMVNFTIPGTGSSGHIGGAMLLAAILGPAPAFLTMSVVLLIQALVFADGGILAYGCNVINMGFFACFIAYPLLFQPILKKRITKKRILVASLLATILSMQLGALSVVLETTLSGITELPFLTFLLTIQPIQFIIGIIEGIITAGVLNYIYQIRPEIIENALGLNVKNYAEEQTQKFETNIQTEATQMNRTNIQVESTQKNRTSIQTESTQKVRTSKNYKMFILIFAMISLLIGGVISQYASTKPDGLEWSIIKTTGNSDLQTDNQVHKNLEEIQNSTAVLSDYSLTNSQNEKLGTSVSGIAGGIAVCLVSTCLGVFIKRRQKRRESGG